MLYVVDLSFIFLILLEDYIQFQKNQSTQLYFCQEIIKPNFFLYFFVTEMYDIRSIFILGRLSLEKKPIKAGFVIERLSNLDIA